MSLSVQSFIEVGTIRGVHGLEGGLLLECTHDIPDLPLTVDRLYVRNSRGDFEPYRVLESHKTLKKGKTLFFVQFDRITDRTGAERMRQHLVFLHPEDQPESTDTHPTRSQHMASVVGYQVLDETGRERGVVSSIIENPAHPILEIQSEGSPKGSLLVPFVEYYIPTVDRVKRQLHATRLDELILD